VEGERLRRDAPRDRGHYSDPALDCAFTRDISGFVTAASNQVAQTAVLRDNPGMATNETHAIAGQTFSYDYFWDRDLSGTLQGTGGVGGLLCFTCNGEAYVPLYDHNGNVVSVVDATGASVVTFVYDAFGRTSSATGFVVDKVHFCFSTKYYDAETGLYYYGYRFYSPELGRWMNRDPIEEEGGVYLYAFCRNSPASFIDRLGMVWKITRESTNNWATAEATDSSDTFETLARTVHFDLAEISKWSNGTISTGTKPKMGCRYQIPNVYVFYTSNRTFFDIAAVVTKWQNSVKNFEKKYKAEGFKTITYFNHNQRKDFANAWDTEGIAGVFYAGHGGIGTAGLTMDASTEDMIFPDEVHPSYKLSIGYFMACDSKNQYRNVRWQDHFAIEYGAVFKGFTGDAYYFTELEGPVVQPSSQEVSNDP
jgi:RHS repeat-associated protein